MRQTSEVNWDIKKLSKIIFLIFVVPILTGLLFLSLAPRIIEHFQKEQCLESGGRYNQELGKCRR